jgi:hypothetical protein
MDISNLDLTAVPEGDLVLKCDRLLTEEQRSNLRDALSRLFPNRKVAVLDPGLHLESIDNRVVLARIEAKLDELLQK